MALEVYTQNKRLLQELEEGDLVEFPRGFFSHWGVYIGDEKIVHLQGAPGNGGFLGTLAEIGSGFTSTGMQGATRTTSRVQIDDFMVVAGPNLAKKNNDKDGKMPPLSPDEIVKRALSKLGTYAYHVLWDNCEHFAAWCRNGDKWSQQAESILETVLNVGAAVVVGGLAFGLAYNKEKK